ncbi:MAG: monovalent cation:proton antiporter-2 (CPA2) family protein [Betaproteobacteria bacterium]|nr:monovalent cation:proton antiporter-2 (CPA2) family protein [Betaproteobacteria bacterium]MDH3438273.1 monovalent cation:proton antiporter-2 (CPA2) family protein [Betaproteobacteria bacterium]
MPSTLQSVLILLATAVLIVVVFRSLRLPPMLGYLIVGVAIGPHALAWIPEMEEASQLAEIGIVFLMFSIGLEFSLPKLITIRRLVFGLGAAQVALTMLAVWAVAHALAFEWRAGLILGGVLAMSSTAILAKILAERLELNTPHGRQIIGVLLFQDLAVVPLLIVVPALESGSGTLAADLGLALLKAAAVLALLLFFGQRLMRAWFHLVARQKSAELFVLNVLLITLGLAYLTEMAGLSLALGAFLAGALISETEYRYQVEVDIRPFRDVLLGLFFVTIGMLLDPQVVIGNFAWVALLLLALLVFKAGLIFGLSVLFERNTGAAMRTGLALAGCGEFGLVLLARADALELVAADVMQPVLGAMLLSMLLAPFMVERSEHVVRRWVRSDWMNRAMQVHNIAVQAMSADRHVVICGFGRSGQNLARLLRQESIPFIALDVDPQRIKEAAAAGESVVFGDAARPEVLTAAGLLRARALAITYADTTSALKILRHVGELRPALPVVVRTRDESDIDRLKSAGAVEVVAEILEGSLILASTTLMLLGVPLNRVLQRMRETREQRYSLFRGFFRGITDETEGLDQANQPRLHSVSITPGAAAIGKQLGELELRLLGVEVTAFRRKNARTVTPDADTRVEEGDVLVLLGAEEGVAAAEMKLMQG